MLFEAFANWLVVLPDPIKAAIAVGILYLVRSLLANRVPDELLIEIAGAITVALVTIINLLLGLIPFQFEAIAMAILNLIAILLGAVFVVNGWRVLKAAAYQFGILF